MQLLFIYIRVYESNYLLKTTQKTAVTDFQEILNSNLKLFSFLNS